MVRVLLLFSLILLFITQISTVVKGQFHERFEDVENIHEVLKAFYPVNVFKRIPPTREDGNSSKCSVHLDLLLNGLISGSTWALQMVDASSKIPSGILLRNQTDLGQFDECRNIKVIEEGEEIRGRHCMYRALAQISNNSLSTSLSICVPVTCEPAEIEKILKNVVNVITGQSPIINDIGLSVDGVQCSAIEVAEWTAGGIVTLVGFSILLAFLAVSTLCDICRRYFREGCSMNSRLGMICHFSVYTNALRIVNTKTTPDTLPAIQGIRFFTMLWIVFGHEFFMDLIGPTVNLLDLADWCFKWDAIFVMTAHFAVDTFFTISGFLISYLFLKEMSKGVPFNIFKYYLHRYLRLTPAFAALLLITIFILPRLSSGPLWASTILSMEERCRQNWWSMLLYVHNYVNEDYRWCLAHSWYLAVEMQFFWISPLILYPLAKKPKIGLFILSLAFIASIVIPAKIGYDNGYSSASFISKDLTKLLLTNFYMESHIRASPWLIGIFLGYLIFTQKRPIKTITKWIGWLLATASFAFSFFSLKKFQEDDYVYDKAWETFYTIVSKPFWGAAVSWVIYACVRGFGGPVTKILSLSIYNPFSRISYCVYLVHFVIQLMQVGVSRVPRYYNTLNIVNMFLSDFGLSCMLGFCLSIVFEAPIIQLERLVRNGGSIVPNYHRKNQQEVEKGSDNPGLTSDNNDNRDIVDYF